MNRRLSNILAVAYKEARMLRHDRALMSTVLAQPLIMVLLFGGALSNTPRNVPWLVLDRAQTASARRLVGDIQATGYFLPPTAATSYDAAIERMRRGRAVALLVLPSDFDRRGHAQLLLDGSDPMTAARVGAIIGSAAAVFRPDPRASGPTEVPATIVIRQRFRFNPTLDDATFYLAAITAMLLTNLCLSASSLGLVGERESGTYEQMLALPTSAIEIVLGKLTPHVVLCYGVLLLGTVLAGVLFGRWPQGSFFTLCVVALPFILASLGIGVFVSTLARTSAQAVFISVFFILPSFVLSGLMMPYEFMPHPVREIGGLTPARWYQIASRAIVARGAGFADVWPSIAVLTGMFVVMLGLIRWRLKPRLG